MADDDCAIADALKMKPDSCRSVLQMQFPICSDLVRDGDGDSMVVQ